VALNAVIESIDADTIYDVPLLMQEERFDEVVLKKLGMDGGETEANLNEWKDFLRRYKNPQRHVRIGLVGKYVELKDSYKSIAEALDHAGALLETHIDVDWIHSEQVTPDNVAERLDGLHGILVAPGFGSRGIDGKLLSIRHARENGIPFFGICLGMQCAVIEFARNVLGLSDAHSTEIKEYTPEPVIDLMGEQKSITNMGGTMRLGEYPCELSKGSKAQAAYHGATAISERHRHRYEFNNAYSDRFEAAGMTATGVNPDSKLVEIVEIPSHPYFVASQFHPEYASTVLNPHPLFVSFVQAAVDHDDLEAKDLKTSSEAKASNAG
jgi:CTP synthase